LEEKAHPMGNHAIYLEEWYEGNLDVKCYENFGSRPFAGLI
jgi:hypothetical protein